MYTATEIRNITFTKGVGGYKVSEVDVFVDRCADTVEALTRDKEELNKKLTVLADKVQEYRRDEDSIRSALLSAQRLGDSVVRDSNQKAEEIIAEAQRKAEEIVAAAKRDAAHYEAELERLKREISDFKADILSLYKDHLSLIKAIPEVQTEKPAAPAVPAEPTEEAAPVEDAAQPTEEETSDEEPAQEDAPKSRFANLKFGEDYDIGEDDD
ncbi:MAG: DivIVA domain-containing protein [Clostridia bacterium]|nr:DivIVA domain-containing protein [Clostridia bacterium]